MDKYLTKLLSIDVGRKSNVILREDVGEHVHIFSHIRLTMYVELMIINIKGRVFLDVIRKSNLYSLNPCLAFPSCLLTNYIVDGVDQLCKKEDDCTKLKFANESSVESMGLTSGIRKVIATGVFTM